MHIFMPWIMGLIDGDFGLILNFPRCVEYSTKCNNKLNKIDEILEIHLLHLKSI